MKDSLLYAAAHASKRTKREGFAVRALGRQGATIFSVLASSAVPRSISFCVWLGLALASSLKPDDLGLNRGKFALVVVAVLCAGIAGLFSDFRLAFAQGRWPDERG